MTHLKGEPRITEMRYSLNHNGWFWSVKVENSFAVVSWDQEVVLRGFARRRSAADRAAQRAMKKLRRRVERARREQERSML